MPPTAISKSGIPSLASNPPLPAKNPIIPKNKAGPASLGLVLRSVNVSLIMDLDLSPESLTYLYAFFKENLPFFYNSIKNFIKQYLHIS